MLTIHWVIETSPHKLAIAITLPNLGPVAHLTCRRGGLHNPQFLDRHHGVVVWIWFVPQRFPTNLMVLRKGGTFKRRAHRIKRGV
jgi:hypothetical protein